MNFQKIRKLEDKITKNRQKLLGVKDPKKSKHPVKCILRMA